VSSKLKTEEMGNRFCVFKLKGMFCLPESEGRKSAVELCGDWRGLCELRVRRRERERAVAIEEEAPLGCVTCV
jgi:hypothetical protein